MQTAPAGGWLSWHLICGVSGTFSQTHRRWTKKRRAQHRPSRAQPLLGHLPLPEPGRAAQPRGEDTKSVSLCSTPCDKQGFFVSFLEGERGERVRREGEVDYDSDRLELHNTQLTAEPGPIDRFREAQQRESETMCLGPPAPITQPRGPYLVSERLTDHRVRQRPLPETEPFVLLLGRWISILRPRERWLAAASFLRFFARKTETENRQKARLQRCHAM